MTENGKAKTIKKLFSRSTSINQSIDADISIIWNLITNASDFTRWNSTVVSLEGKIQKGQKIKLKSTLDPKRTFKLKVKEMKAPHLLIWGDGMGERIYKLEEDGTKTHFTMMEKIGGPLFPLFAGMIPSFDDSFEQFAQDLKKEAELMSTKK